jgi:putative lipoprotein
MSRFRVALFVTIAFILTGSFALSQSSDQIGPPSTWQSNTPKPAGPSVSGTVAYRERIALPPNAAIEVKLQDVSLQDAPAKTVAETVFAAEGKQVPIPFQLSYNPSDINMAHTYQVLANINVDGKLMFTTTTAYPVLTQGAPSQVTMMLQQAPAPAGSASGMPAAAESGTKLRDTRWVLAEVNGKPAQPGEGQSAHLKLHKKGSLTGSTGCNNLVGSYIASEGALQFTPSAATMKMCTPAVAQQEQAFLAALKATTAYKVDGETLKLMNEEQVLAKFQAEAK